jgi:1-deoxy-D-xylulose-5-phosphate reductoisomerase
MISVSGLDGLKPSLILTKYSKNLAIVNKESLICGWNLIKKELVKFNVNFFPVDSEHFSIFSLIDNHPNKIIDQIFLTASGGPFLNYTYSKLSDVKIAQALKHPTWNMGKKISVDSSTMMNKLFEVIEAKKIFNIPYKKINIIIHPKSYVHALVRFNNGITKILVHDPDMKIPIHNSLYYKRNMQFKTKSLNFKILNNLDFKSVNYKKFPLLKLLNNLPKNDSLYETVLVTINDFFVSIYLNKKIDYKRLVHLIYSYSNKKIFHKFKKKIPKNVNEIYKTKNFVYTKLSNWGI